MSAGGGGYSHTSIADIPSLDGPAEGEWKPIRHHFGIQAFGVNGWIARQAGEEVIEEHDEVEDGTAEHEELYFVAGGSARFTVDGESFDAPAGTLVFVGDSKLVRRAVASEPGTTVLSVGAAPGVPFSVSPWERRRVEQSTRLRS